MITHIQNRIAGLTYRAGKYPKKYHKKIKPYIAFTKATLSNPRSVGAACPSSPFLAKVMAEQVDVKKEGYVIELGGGTGRITRALLEHGIPPDKLITVEYSPELARHLREEFPDIQVLEGDAGKLDQLLADLGNPPQHIKAIVSGLPLRSLPKSTVKAIKKNVYKLLDDKGLFIQFTYDLRTSSSQKNKFRLIDSSVVYRNIPPARVNTYMKRV